MKKNIVIATLSIVLAFNIVLNLTGIHLFDFSEEQVISSDDSWKYIIISGDEEFSSQINDNPIDNTYKIREIELIQGNISYMIDYREAWENQILFTTETLEKYLSEDDLSDLVEANEYFFEYLYHTKSVELAIYEPLTEYRVSDQDIPTGDGLHFPYIYIVNAERTKQRAIELLSYLYTFTSELEWIEV